MLGHFCTKVFQHVVELLWTLVSASSHHFNSLLLSQHGLWNERLKNSSSQEFQFPKLDSCLQTVYHSP
nr:hypothetical protein BgiMline_028345 [Biomphalaria glabrata]